jgi:hypothetical protein
MCSIYILSNVQEVSAAFYNSYSSIWAKCLNLLELFGYTENIPEDKGLLKAYC